MDAFALLVKKARLGGPTMLLAAALFNAGMGANAFAGPKTHTVVIEAMQFTPQTLEVHPGDTVMWHNKDPFPHNVIASDRSFQSKEIAPDASWKYKVVKKGIFPYMCTLHPTMKASLVVK